MISYEDRTEIIKHSHFWNWSPDWNVLFKIYDKFPDSYSVLTPFAYAYLEELIRSTTKEYGIKLYDKNRMISKIFFLRLFLGKFL